MPTDIFDTMSRKNVRIPSVLMDEAREMTAAGGDLKKQLLDRANKVKSDKVKKYVQGALMKKIDQAGDAAAAWLEKLESDFGKLKPEGLMKGFEDSDFDDLWLVLTGDKRKKSSDVLLFPGAGDGNDDGDKTHHWKLGKIADRVAQSVVASMSRYCAFYLAVNDKWYMELADKEYGERHDAMTYGPFESLEKARRFLNDSFSNPGSFYEDDRGTKLVPTRSPNGKPVQKPRLHENVWD